MIELNGCYADEHGKPRSLYQMNKSIEDGVLRNRTFEENQAVAAEHKAITDLAIITGRARRKHTGEIVWIKR